MRRRRGTGNRWSRTEVKLTTVQNIEGFGEWPGEECVEAPENIEGRADVEFALQHMTDEERKLYSLVYCESRSVSDIAVILPLGSWKNVKKHVDRMTEVAGFYCRYRRAIETLPGLQAEGVEPELVRLLHRMVTQRQSYQQLAGECGLIPSRLCVAVRRARRWLRIQSPGHADMLDDYFSKSLYVPRRRTMNEWREKVRSMLLSLTGKVWYVWGGQDIKNKMVADCSGLVLQVFQACGVLPPKWPDMGARSISLLYQITKSPEPGDLAFYGPSWPELQHVMVYIGNYSVEGFNASGVKIANSIPEAVAGMTGGDRTYVSEEWARAKGAGLFVRKARYRKDFLGYRKVEPKGGES